MRSINIIGCGPSAELWDGQGESLGVNDCEKIGKQVQNLLVVDFPLKFPPERFKVIQDSKAEFYSHLTAWMRYKQEMNLIDIRRWKGYLETGKVNFSLTSPFVAVSLAWVWGYQEIVLWGVDMNNNKPYIEEERLNFRQLTFRLWDHGIKIYLGASGSQLNFLDIR